MMKNYFLTLLLITLISVTKAQQPGQPVSLQGIYNELSAEQKTSFRQVHERYRSQMQLVLQQKEDPLLRREKINQLRASRDSSLRVILGEQLYQQYRQPMEGAKGPVGRKSPSVSQKTAGKSNVASKEIEGSNPNTEKEAPAEIKILAEPIEPKSK